VSRNEAFEEEKVTKKNISDFWHDFCERKQINSI